jgi:heme/copper-type cytochrome/quinol oxidase subunit 2
MRLIVLEGCAAIAAILFLTALATTALHRAQRRSEEAYRISALAEYLWIVVPWVMITACAYPAVRLIVAGH